MTEDQVREAKEKLSAKQNGQLRMLFYNKKNGLPKQGLYSKEQIISKLGVPEPENDFEREGIFKILHSSLSLLRKEAKEHGLAWVDLRIEKNKGRDVHWHGYSDDTDKLEKTIELYNERQSQHETLSKLTEDVCKQRIKLKQAS